MCSLVLIKSYMITFVWAGIFSQEDCEIWRDSFKSVSYVAQKFWQKPVFLKKLQTVWEKHLEFNGASNTLLLENTRYKSLKNDYDNCLAIRAFEPEVEPDGSSYLANLVEPWLLEWIRDPCPLAYIIGLTLFLMLKMICLHWLLITLYRWKAIRIGLSPRKYDVSQLATNIHNFVTTLTYWLMIDIQLLILRPFMVILLFPATCNVYFLTC